MPRRRRRQPKKKRRTHLRVGIKSDDGDLCSADSHASDAKDEGVGLVGKTDDVESCSGDPLASGAKDGDSSEPHSDVSDKFFSHDRTYPDTLQPWIRVRIKDLSD